MVLDSPFVEDIMKSSPTQSLGALLGLFIVIGCGGGGATLPVITPPTDTSEVESVLLANEAGAIMGSATTTAPLPSGGTAAPLSLLDSSDQIGTIRGSTLLITFSSPSALRNLWVQVSGVGHRFKIEMAGPFVAAPQRQGDVLVYPQYGLSIEPGALKAQTRSPEVRYNLILTLAQTISPGSRQVDLVGELASGATTRPATSQVQISSDGAASESLRATLQWTLPVDVDLHVVTPAGTDIGYQNPSAEGGTLDVDSYAGCGSGQLTVENIVWDSERPAPGIYQIRPNYYKSCGNGLPVRYTLTVRQGPGMTRYIGQQFDPTEANGNSGTIATKIASIFVPPPANTDEGILFRLFLAETRNPGGTGYDFGQAQLAIRALRSIVQNRMDAISSRNLASYVFSTSIATVPGVVFANGEFAGFFPGISPAIEARVMQQCMPPSALGAAANPFKDFWQFALAASLSSVTDPYGATFTALDGSEVDGGTYYVRTAGASSPTPNARKMGTIAGQDFYSLKKGYLDSVTR